MITIIRIIILIRQLQLASRFGLLWLNMSNFSTNISPNPNQMEVKEKEEALKESTELMEMYAGNYHPHLRPISHHHFRNYATIPSLSIWHKKTAVKVDQERQWKEDLKNNYMKIFILISREAGQGREEVERRGNRKIITMIIILWSFGKMPLMVIIVKVNQNIITTVIILCVWSSGSMFFMVIIVQVNQEDESYIEITLPLPFSIL